MPASFSPLVFGVPPILINNGEKKTRESGVTINLFVKNAYQMQVDDTPDFNGVSWEPYEGVKRWKLPPQDGAKKIYARFKSLNGIPSKIIIASIVLDTTSPSNVSNFQADAEERKIGLIWENSPDPDFAKVKIVRREDFYPANSQDGITVYDGRGKSFTDFGLTSGVTYYYAAFAYDDLGNYSSGAIAAATPGAGGISPEIPITPSPPEIEKIGLGEFEFIQNGKIIKPINGAITIDRFRSFTISIPYEKVPEVLKTIMVTLEQGDKIFSFLLRANEDKTAYAATLVSPDAGEYPFIISILDYKNQAYKKISGNLNIIKTQIAQDQTIIRYITIKKFPPLLFAIFILLMILVTGGYVYRGIIKYKKAKKIK